MNYDYPLLNLQLWSPDTCRCSVHQGVTEWPDDATLESMNNIPKDIVYLTRREAVDLHADRFIRKPENTQRWPFFYLFQHVSLPIRRHLRPLFHLMASRVQARSRQCQWHAHMGETQALYDVVYEENIRKNICQHIAWRIANGISDEDLAWLNAAPSKRIHSLRLSILERVVPLLEIDWGIDRDGPMNSDGSIGWQSPAPLRIIFPPDVSLGEDKISEVQDACEARFPGLVMVM